MLLETFDGNNNPWSSWRGFSKKFFGEHLRDQFLENCGEGDLM
jgi:hypothetical protein